MKKMASSKNACCKHIFEFTLLNFYEIKQLGLNILLRFASIFHN